MNHRVYFRKIVAGILVMAPLVLLQSCGFFGGKKDGGKDGAAGGGSKSRGRGRGDVGIVNGEVAATQRKGFKQPTPLGMVMIPSGSFMMGQADEDVAATQVSFNKRVTISQFYMDDTEITNNEYRQFVNAMLTDSVSTLGEEYIMTKLYPDTTVWRKDFTYHNGDPMTEYYYSSPAFDMYPVVGVSWLGARDFCKWRTAVLNEYRTSEGQFMTPKFELPTEAQFEWAARGGKASAKYPWGNPYVANGKGCLLANFKPQRGNYDADGYAYTAPANSYNPNDFGLYNMSGNVAEWCLDSYADASTVFTWDLNLINNDPNEPRKIVRGGSWKDVAYFLETGTRSWEYETSTRSYIGFRCAMEHLGRSSGREFR